jgi:hypothetical protein
MKKLLAAFLTVASLLMGLTLPASAEPVYDEDCKSPLYLAEYGKTVVGPEKVGDFWFYNNEDGSQYTGWTKTSDGHRRYYKYEGNRAFGWQKIGGKDYYFDKKTGYLLTGTYKIGGKVYTFDADGVCAGRAVDRETAAVYKSFVDADWGTSAEDVMSALTAKGIEYDYVKHETASIIMPLEAQVYSAGGVSVIAFEFYYFCDNTLIKAIAALIGDGDTAAFVTLADPDSKKYIKLSELKSYDLVHLDEEDLAAFTKAQYEELVKVYGEADKFDKTLGYYYGTWFLHDEDTYINSSSVMPYYFSMSDMNTSAEYEASDDKCFNELMEKHFLLG